MRLYRWSLLLLSLLSITIITSTGLAQEGTEEPVLETATPTQTETVTPTVTLTETPTTIIPSETPTSEAAPTETPTATLTLTPDITLTVNLTMTATPSPTAMATTEYITRVDQFGISQVWVPPGCFLMGMSEADFNLMLEYTVDYIIQHEVELEYPDAIPRSQERLRLNTPEHQVCIETGFWMDQYEVTNQAYQAFIDTGGYTNPAYWSAEGWDWVQSEHITGPEILPGYDAPLQPRVGISWYEAEAYAAWRGGLLPSEAQWEYAASGPNNYAYPWGNEFDASRLNFCDIHCLTDWAHAGDDGVELTTIVGQYETGRSWVGAYDMAGNAEEWTSDLLLPYLSPGEINSLTTPRVHRGGDFFNDWWDVRTDNRDSLNPRWRDRHSGVRIIYLQ